MPELTVEQAIDLAVARHQAGNLADAEIIYRKILAHNPRHADALHLLGMVQFQNGRVNEAAELVEQAIARNPKIAIYHNNYGQVLERLFRPDDAATAYREAMRLDPTYAEPHNNLANVLERKGLLGEAIEEYEIAIRLKPAYAEPHTNLGNIRKDQGDLDRAIASYRRAIELRPDLSLLHSNLLLVLHYQTGIGPAQLAAEHRAWRQRHADPLRASIQPHSNSRDPQRRLRIGYVSGDFRDHPVARFMLPVLEHHDRQQVEVFAYTDTPKPDAITDRVRQHVDVWRQTTDLPDQRVAEMVRSDQIDVLVDLMAHTSNTRLLVFARKPAPVQVTYLAYVGSTGLDVIDYRLTDPYLDPAGTDLTAYAEQSVFLPETYWCYSPPTAAPPVNGLPAATARELTFGCLNNFCKVTDLTLKTWTQLLRAEPDARLLLHARDGTHRQRVFDALRAGGVADTRVTFVSRVSLGEYFSTYHRIDVGLDPFPFTGGTTTCDALWMGVPVVSLAGETGASRGGLSLLSNVGLANLVAHDPEEYVQIALELARDRPRLAALRAGLRERLLHSPVMDAPRFTRNLEAAFRDMWCRWCARSGES